MTKLKNKQLKEMSEGIALALLVYMTVSSAAPLLLPVAHAQGAPIFSATLIASTGNPVRRQYASIIAANMRSVGIDAKLFYVNFDVLDTRMFFRSASPGSSFDQGGYDMGFIGWGQTSPVPDIRSNYDGRPSYMAPAGTNYALYNSQDLNAIWDELYATVDPAQQKVLMDKAQEILYRDKPYNFIYEPTDTIPIASKWNNYGSANVYNEVTFPDVEHWSGGNTLTFAEVSNVFPDNNLNPANTPSSNSFYAVYIYAAICYAGASLQAIDSRDLTFYKAMADNITHSGDDLQWTVHIKPGMLWQDGVEVTADDFVFTEYATTNASINSVALGNNIQYLGNYVTFTFLNGTTRVDDNTAGASTKTVGSWKTLDRYTFTFTLPKVYAFTSQTYTAFSPVPMHILEQIPFSQWDSNPYSTASKPATYTWDVAKYPQDASFNGGKGSWTQTGPVCAGPYYLDNYDFTSNVATLKKFNRYWNATGLEQMGQFTVDTYKVAWIESKDAAIAALKNGEVDILDYNYQLAKDEPTLSAIPGVKILHNVELGWQEQGFNMMNPVFGTGTDTPAGKADPTKAADAARSVRSAISHLIPREQIIKNLLAGAGTPIATLLGPGWGVWYDPSLAPDTYDVQAAVSDLNAAGYSVSVAPPPPIALAGTPMLGQSVTVSGTSQVADEYVVIYQSADGGSTWNPIAAAVADNSSKYSVQVAGPPVFGTVWYAANFTGYTAPNETIAMASMTPDLVNSYIDSGAVGGGKQLVPCLSETCKSMKLSEPITVSSATNDALVVLVPIIIIVVVGALVMRTRKKKTT